MKNIKIPINNEAFRQMITSYQCKKSNLLCTQYPNPGTTSVSVTITTDPTKNKQNCEILKLQMNFCRPEKKNLYTVNKS